MVVNRGQLCQPVGLLRQISHVFDIVTLQKRKFTSLVYKSTFSRDEAGRMHVSLD